MTDTDDLILISVDDHIIEPPDLFAHHLDARYQDRAPKLVRNDEGSDVWKFGEVVMETAALNAVAGRPKEEYGLEPQSLDEVRPGCYDPARAGQGHERRRRPRVDELPVVPDLHGSDVPDRRPRPVARPGACVQRLAHRRVVRGPSRSLHPHGGPGPVGRRADRRRGATHRGQGLPLAQLHREPRGPRLPELPRGVLGSVVAGVLRHEHRAVDPPRLVRSPGHPGRRLAART